jgi:hypothetical protein
LGPGAPATGLTLLGLRVVEDHYPDEAPGVFYGRVLEDGATLPSVLALPSRKTVIQAVRGLAPGGGTAREAGAWLDGGLDILRQIAKQYFTHEAMLLTHYSEIGTKSLRTAGTTLGCFELQKRWFVRRMET